MSTPTDRTIHPRERDLYRERDELRAVSDEMNGKIVELLDERDELRAEIARLREGDHLEYSLAVTNDELRAENERLRQGQHVITLTSGAVGRTSVTVPCGCAAEVERLRRDWDADRADQQEAYSRVSAESERLRAALEKIARIDLLCDEPHCQIAREALGHHKEC